MASAYIKRHESWQKYAKKELDAGRKPIKFKDWKPPARLKRHKPLKNKWASDTLKGVGINPRRYAPNINK